MKIPELTADLCHEKFHLILLKQTFDAEKNSFSAVAELRRYLKNLNPLVSCEGHIPSSSSLFAERGQLLFCLPYFSLESGVSVAEIGSLAAGWTNGLSSL